MPRPKLIFIDLDGVILLGKENGESYADPTCVALLNQLISACDVLQVWVISERRNTTSNADLFTLLEAAGVEHVTGIAPRHIPQSVAIARIVQHMGADSWVVIDDDATRYEQAPAVLEHLVLTTNRHGLTASGVVRACAILGVPSPVSVPELQTCDDANL